MSRAGELSERTAAATLTAPTARRAALEDEMRETPGTDQATFSATSRSCQDGTKPLRRTSLPVASTSIAEALLNPSRPSAPLILSAMALASTGGRSCISLRMSRTQSR